MINLKIETSTAINANSIKNLQDGLIRQYNEKCFDVTYSRNKKQNLKELQNSDELNLKQIQTANAKIMCCREHQDTLHTLKTIWLRIIWMINLLFY